MNYFLRGYCEILSELEKYKKKIIIHNKSNNKKYIEEIDELLFKKYIKIEHLLKDYNK